MRQDSSSNVFEEIHPGWLAQHKTPIEILAFKLDMSVADITAQMLQALEEIVESVLRARNQSEHKRYLEQREIWERREIQKVFAEVKSQRQRRIHLPSVAPSYQHHYIHALKETFDIRGGFFAYLPWYSTENWGSDSWAGFLWESEVGNASLTNAMLAELVLEYLDEDLFSSAFADEDSEPGIALDSVTERITP